LSYSTTTRVHAHSSTGARIREPQQTHARAFMGDEMKTNFLTF